MITTTQGQLYITALGSLERLDIQFVPKEVNPVRTANWADVLVVGRNNPLHHYTGGSNDLTLELDFLADDEERESVVARCSMLESWAMNDGLVKPPERLRLTYGKLFKEDVIWIIKRVDVRYSQFSPAHNMLPTQAYVTLTLTMDTNSNRTKANVTW